MNKETCPLCNASNANQMFEDNQRRYFRCELCKLIFVPAIYHLSPLAEKSVYDHHQNSPDDPNYRQFLSRLFNPVHARIAACSQGFDFGSGPGPTLSVMFEEAGHSMAIYDPFYATDTSPLTVQYDFVTTSEVAEHFHNPRKELRRLWECVKPGGLMGIMTKLAKGQEAFSHWHYKNDPTHVSFYSRETFTWLAAELNAELSFVGNDVILLEK